MVISPYIRGAYDLHWDDPAVLNSNAAWTVLGVNVYRSDESDRGPYIRLNEFPLGGTFYRDQGDVVPVEEIVNWDTGWWFRGDAPNNPKWVIRTQNPFVKPLEYSPNGRPVWANAPEDVRVFIDDVEQGVFEVFGRGCEVTLVPGTKFDCGSERFSITQLPDENSVVRVSYLRKRNDVLFGQDRRLHYRLTTVALDPDDSTALRETPLDYSEAVTSAEIEKMGWIWREAVRRNNWILEQGGERIKVFIRKQSGILCSCSRDLRTLEYTKQPEALCERCFGTGFLGGYEGPYDLTIAPDDAERRLSQGVRGRRKEHNYEVWTGPSPLLTMRDFLVKQTNERYSVGAVRRPSNRGNLLQQHFTIAYLDDTDIRYKIPIDGVSTLPWPQTRYGVRPTKSEHQMGIYEAPWPVEPNSPYGYTPQGTEKDNIPNSREHRGRTPVYENTEY
jgi:hypothetical protein